MNMQQIMRQAQKMQKQIEEIQAKAADEVVEVASGGGMVKVKMNGKQELISIVLEKEVIDPDDSEMLQDLIISAVNEGIKKSQTLMQERLQSVTGGLGINMPGIF
ncbi:MAG: YbaB/EbfC family nucleoid-associated protein [Deferribacteraceae bacterium]|jgi:DNA-binding YbaB/EbfC family protein|nr:YbaB/EbfC family nucleoid-associated protein [Deferribacteraceae bacterium]